MNASTIDYEIPLHEPAARTLDDLGGAAEVNSTGDLTNQIAGYVEHYPALSFATAFVVGVTCAWWLKRA